LVETLIASLIFSKLKLTLQLGKLKIHKSSYNIKPIFKIWSIYPVLFMSILYIILQAMVLRQNYSFLPYQKIFKDALIGSYMLLGLDVLFRYEKYKPFIIACCSSLLGFGLNAIVMYFNNGKMPIFPTFSWSTGYTQYDMIINASKYGDFHVLGDHTTKLIFLSDVFDVFTSIWSLGDIFIRLFAFMIIYYSVKTVNQSISISQK